MRRVLLVGTAFVAAGLGVLAWATDVVRRPELLTVDARFDVRGREAPHPDVVLVGLDHETLRRLDVRPPLPRSYHAEVIDRLKRAGARVIAYDFEFAQQTSEAEDTALLESLRRAGNVVVAASRFYEDGTSDVLGGPRGVEYTDAEVGSVNFPPTVARGGIVRQVPFADGTVPTFAVAAAGGRASRSREPAWIDYAGPPGTYPVFPLWRAHDGEQPRGGFRDKIVVVGATATALNDILPAATGAGMPGAEIHANAIATLLRGTPLEDAPDWLAILVIVLAGIAAPLAALRWRGLRWLPVPVVVILALPVAAQLAFGAGLVLPLVAPLFAAAAGTAGTFAVAYATDLRDRRRLRAAFGRFVPPAVVDEIVAQANGDVRLGGVELNATVMFCDMRGFTSLAETLDPRLVIALLSEYHTAMSDAILDHGGTVVTYLGDGIMAVFGAPLPQDDHADRALAAAREMLGPALARVNAWAAGHGIAELRVGIGLCTGPVMSGNVGSERRLEYAAVGDTTNTAARLQSMTKEAGCPILVADSTRAAATDGADLREVGELAIRGRDAPLRAWTFA